MCIVDITLVSKRETTDLYEIYYNKKQMCLDVSACINQ